MAADPIVCCVKWGTKYPASYANRLRRMVGRHLPGPHDFVCLTDDPAGLDPEITPITLPDTTFVGWWNKICLFRRDLFETGRLILYFDVDLVMVGPLDFMLDDAAVSIPDLTILRGFSKNFGFNSSVMRIRAGALPQVYDRFAENAEAIMASGRTDQDWIHEQVPDAALFPQDKIVSYKKDMNSHVFLMARKLGLDFLKAPRFMTVRPPAGASIVVFHGKPDPEDVMDAPYGPWKRAPFIKEHWR